MGQGVSVSEQVTVTNRVRYEQRQIQHTEDAKQVVLAMLEHANTPLRPREITQSGELSSGTLKRALWYLIDEGKVMFTEDRRVCRK